MSEGRTLKEYLEYLRDAGVREVWGENSFGGNPEAHVTTQCSCEPVTQLDDREYGALQSEFPTLEGIREFVGDCTRCKLSKGRTNIVFGVGDPNAKLMFVGEGPGHDEDIQGEPFVGRAGQLLTDMIEKGTEKLGIGLKRKDVYIANIVKCRPPGNRNPEDDEIESCEPFLLRQIAVIRPKIICALGKFAAQTLLKTKTPISALRGKVFDFHGIKLVPTFHPAYLLRNPKEKALVWEDIKTIMALYQEAE